MTVIAPDRPPLQQRAPHSTPKGRHYKGPLPFMREHVFLFLDTEFTDFDTRELISVGLVDRNGREFYAEVEDFPLDNASNFVFDTVMPLLGAPGATVVPKAEVSARLKEWLAAYAGMTVVIVHGFFADYELVFDLMLGEEGWGCGRESYGGKYARQHLLDLAERLGLGEIVMMDVAKQLSHSNHLEHYFQAHPEAQRHHALHDARALASAFKRPALGLVS